METRRLDLTDWVMFFVVLLGAGGARFWYLHYRADGATNDGPVQVQGCPAAEQDKLVDYLKRQGGFGSLALLADVEERTAHVAPGYPWLLSFAAQWSEDWKPLVRWLQAALGTLTAGVYFLLARRAFRSQAVGLLTGLFCAFYPFWIANCAEICDGTLVTFLLSACLLLGLHAGQVGGPTTSLLFGVTLAALGLVRAALLPFAVVTMLWFLLRCRWLRRGWLFALLAFLGFVNGLVPWTLRNFQALGDVVPVVDSAYLHLWIGNNPQADGGSFDQVELSRRVRENVESVEGKQTGAPAAAKVVADLKQKSRRDRYRFLAWLVVKNIQEDPAGAVQRRISSGLCFVFGSEWIAPKGSPARPALARGDDRFGGLLAGTLLGALLLAVLGWRWSYPFQKTSMPLSLALVWVPLPYILSHAEALSGPRLPLDGVLLCYAAFALACLVPSFGRDLFRGPDLKAE